MTSPLVGALFSEIKSTLKVDFVEASSKLDTLETAANNIENLLEKMFTNDDRIAVYVFCIVVLIVCALTLYKVHWFETVVLTKLEEFSRHNRSLTSERESLSPPSSLNYSATQERVVPRP